MDSHSKEEIDAAWFAAVDMRVGQVSVIEDFPEARNPAWKVAVDFGPLGTRRIAGFRSQFLLLGAVDGDSVVRLLSPDAGAKPGDPIA